MKKHFLSFVAIIQIAILMTAPLYSASAFLGGGSSIPDPVDSAKRIIEEVFGFDDQDAFIGTLDQKVQPVQVSVQFLDAGNGKKTAVATLPTGDTSLQDAYYTWYLKRAGGRQTAPKFRGDNRLPHGDYWEIPEGPEQWKVEAVREMFRGHFDPMRFDDSSILDPIIPDLANNGRLDAINIGGTDFFEYGEKLEGGDGYTAKLGGHSASSASGVKNYCYIYNQDAGEAAQPHELIAGASNSDLVCPEDTDPICLLETEIECNAGQPDATIGEDADADGTPDDTGVSGEFPGGVQIVKVLACGTNNETPKCQAQDQFGGRISNFRPICERGGKPFCVARENLDSLVSQEANQCGPLTIDPITKIPVDPEGIPRDLRCDVPGSNKLALLANGGNPPTCDEDVAVLWRNDDSVLDSFNSQNLENLCKPPIQLFPMAVDSPLALSFGSVAGDGNYEQREERFWGSDPNSDQTIPGFKDEEVVVGRGMFEFTWDFVEGDEIGLAIHYEGPGTKHDDSSRQKLWALMGDGCSIINTGSYEEVVRGKSITFLVAEVGEDAGEARSYIDDCVADNMVSPTATQVELNVEPRIVGPGTVITQEPSRSLEFTGSVTEVDANNAKYKWFIEYSPTFESDGLWIAENRESVLQDRLGLGATIGNSEKKITMNADFPDEYFDADGVGYVRVRMRVTARANADEKIFGEAIYVMQINKSESPLRAYLGQPSGDELALGIEICVDGDDVNAGVCRVVPNEVIVVQYTPASTTVINEDVTWTVNGEPVSCSEATSSLCAPDAPATILMPIGKNTGVLELRADVNELSKLETTERLSLAKSFVVTQPQVEIVPQGGADPYVSGTYTTPTGEVVENIDSEYLIAAPGSSVSFGVEFTPTFIEADTELAWSINGQDPIIGESISFFPEEGRSSVSLIGNYNVPADRRTAIQTLFGVSFVNSARLRIEDQVLVDTDGAATGAVAQGFFATAASNAPEYFIFLLRIVLVMGVMLFAASFALSFRRDQ